MNPKQIKAQIIEIAFGVPKLLYSSFRFSVNKTTLVFGDISFICLIKRKGNKNTEKKDIKT